MNKKFKLNIVTPERTFFSGEAESLIVNTPTGEMGILYHTLPMVTILKTGVMRICRNDRWMEAANAEGFVSVLRDGVTVLAESCFWPHEVDVERVDSEIDQLHEKERKAKSAQEYKMAKAQLEVQFAKLRIKKTID